MAAQLPPTETFIVQATELYERIRDLNKLDATREIASALINSYGAGGEAVFTSVDEHLSKARDRALAAVPPRTVA